MGTRALGRVYEVTDNGKERTSRVVVDKLTQPAGVAFQNGNLYVMAIDKVLRFDGIEKNPSVAPVDMTAAFQLPKEQHHNWKYIHTPVGSFPRSTKGQPSLLARGPGTEPRRSASMS